MFSKKIKTIIKVDGMSCMHCASNVKTSLEKLDNIKKVDVNLSKKEVTIISTSKLNEEEIKNVIENLEYKYQGIVK
jgi:copper chaperone CopZ